MLENSYIKLAKSVHLHLICKKRYSWYIYIYINAALLHSSRLWQINVHPSGASLDHSGRLLDLSWKLQPGWRKICQRCWIYYSRQPIVRELCAVEKSTEFRDASRYSETFGYVSLRAKVPKRRGEEFDVGFVMASGHFAKISEWYEGKLVDDILFMSLHVE